MFNGGNMDFLKKQPLTELEIKIGEILADASTITDAASVLGISRDEASRSVESLKFKLNIKSLPMLYVFLSKNKGKIANLLK